MMRKGISQLFELLKQSTIFWTFAFFSFAIFRFYGIEEDMQLLVNENIMYRNFKVPLLIATIGGFCLGLLYGIVNFFHEKYLQRKLSLGIGLLLLAFLNFAATIAIFTISLSFFSNFFPIQFETEIGWWINDKGFWVTMLYIVLASLVFSFIKIAKERFGQGVFFKMLLGHYKNPREEKRIFMFLDLKDSTTIAEKLGYHKYSQFIQDCFIDLNEIVLDYEAEIYQYVGDEVVLSWLYKKGIENNNCVRIFYAFEEKRKSKNNYYQEKYGFYPEFKAGLHGGKLIAAEVGFVKKDLAYHGDVINTSARIQAECNKYNELLLISEKLLNNLSMNVRLNTTFLGNTLLKGKQKEIKIHSIRRM